MNAILTGFEMVLVLFVFAQVVQVEQDSLPNGAGEPVAQTLSGECPGGWKEVAFADVNDENERWEDGMVNKYRRIENCCGLSLHLSCRLSAAICTVPAASYQCSVTCSIRWDAQWLRPRRS